MNQNNISKSKFYPYLISLVVIVYITTQFLALTKNSNTGVMLEEVSKKQQIIFNFLIDQSIESAVNTASYPNLEQKITENKEELMKILSFSKMREIKDVLFFDVNGNLISSSNEDISIFNYVSTGISNNSISSETVGEIRYSEYYDDKVIDIIVPVFENGKMVGMLCQVESFETINNSMQSTLNSDTTETYVVDSNGVILSSIDGEDNSKNTINITSSANKITTDGYIDEAYLNYNENLVYGYHISIGLNNLKLITEIAQDEVNSSFNSMNLFILKSVALVLAVTKVFEPIIKKMQSNKNDKTKKVDCDKVFKKYDGKNKFLLKYYSTLNYIKNKICIYKDKVVILNILVTGIVCVISVSMISIIQIDSDIKSGLDSSNKINNKIVGYYINEVQDIIYTTVRSINESFVTDRETYLNQVVNNNSEVLNILIYDDSEVTFESNDYKSNFIDEIISDGEFIENKISTSDIYYDEEINSYILFITSKIIDTTNEKDINFISIIYFDECIDILSLNELYPNRILSILLEDSVMYSTNNRNISSKNYELLTSDIDKISSNNENIFNVNKYVNSNDEEVYFSYLEVDINQNEKYYSLTEKIDWYILYEENVYDARSRRVKSTLNFCFKFAFSYVEKINNMIA